MSDQVIALVHEVHKAYENKIALDGLTLQIAADRTIALIGPNGAGKATLLEILLGLRRPDRGQVQVLGNDVVEDPQAHVDRIGVQLQETRLFGKVTAREYFRFFGGIYSRTLPVEELASMLGLASFIDLPLAKLSGGQRQRVALALALVNDPEFVILDEPTVGLDPIARQEFWTLIRRLRSDGRTLLFSTHYMEEAEALADEIIMISSGRLIASGPPQDVVERAGHHGCRNLDEAYRHFAGAMENESKEGVAA